MNDFKTVDGNEKPVVQNDRAETGANRPTDANVKRDADGKLVAHVAEGKETPSFHQTKDETDPARVDAGNK